MPIFHVIRQDLGIALIYFKPILTHVIQKLAENSSQVGNFCHALEFSTDTHVRRITMKVSLPDIATNPHTFSSRQMPDQFLKAILGKVITFVSNLFLIFWPKRSLWEQRV